MQDRNPVLMILFSRLQKILINDSKSYSLNKRRKKNVTKMKNAVALRVNFSSRDEIIFKLITNTHREQKPALLNNV